MKYLIVSMSVWIPLPSSYSSSFTMTTSNSFSLSSWHASMISCSMMVYTIFSLTWSLFLKWSIQFLIWMWSVISANSSRSRLESNSSSLSLNVLPSLCSGVLDCLFNTFSELSNDMSLLCDSKLSSFRRISMVYLMELSISLESWDSSNYTISLLIFLLVFRLETFSSYFFLNLCSEVELKQQFFKD